MEGVRRPSPDHRRFSVEELDADPLQTRLENLLSSTPPD
jgi:hypothetical protein